MAPPGAFLNYDVVAQRIAGRTQVDGLVELGAFKGDGVGTATALTRNLNKLTSLPILLWDERLTTQIAERMLIDADQSRKRRAEVIDKLAATLILQSALDRLRHDASL